MNKVNCKNFNYKGTKIIIKNTNYNFSHYVIEKYNYLIIIYGVKCINKNRVLHRAIKKTRE